jgi:hypothetical protein
MSNPFANWTPQMVDEFNARKKGKRTFGAQLVAATETMRRIPINVKTLTKTKRPLLNRTESLWKAELERRGHNAIYAQSITLRLGDDCRYLPDLVTITPALDGAFSMTCYETKAPHAFRKAGIVKIKAAAKQYPFIRFVLVMRDKSNWTEKEIGNE